MAQIMRTKREVKLHLLNESQSTVRREQAGVRKKEPARKKRVAQCSTNTDRIYTAAASLEILGIKA